ncbi:mechanosensitive ion channel family protein [Luminiphilus sp.]|jgi:MscS family membrane protein|nr:mechanosensitive ion channel family protein [Halieaceae bacterium]MCH1579748.1 mechanosensitive ion channel family protein [Luminiphilus sp.]MDA8619187.1 mechanosensitive ion channel family protein [Luminiphilus sp.]MDB2365044.1 mechanosensitive ion channel family protein [Luminiphilus sp.]
MLFLRDLLEPIAGVLHVPTDSVVFTALLLVGITGHYTIYRVVKGLTIAADRTDTRWDDVFLYSVFPPIQWVMWVILGLLSLSLFNVLDGIREALLRLSDTAILSLVGWLAHRLSRGIEEELLSEHRGALESGERATINAVARLSRIVIWAIAGIMILQSLGVSVSGLLAFGGVGGIAVGFAAKDLLANFLGGLSIFLDRPFAVGDWIRSPDREVEGTVENVGWRITRIRTFDQRPLYVPNSVFSTVAIENPSRMRNRRIYETIGVRYSDSAVMAEIVSEVEAMLRGHGEIDQSRTLIVNFVSFGSSSLDFFIYTFTRTTDWVTYHGVKQEILLNILEIIERMGADIAFPTRTVLLDPGGPRLGADDRDA